MTFKPKIKPGIMELFVQEIGTMPNSTASQLFVDSRPFGFVIEDGHRDEKVPGETRIPAGRYKVVPRYKGKFYTWYKSKYQHKFSIQIADVPGFEDILIHIGNANIDTRGCLLVNRKIGLAREYYGLDSASIYKELYSVIEAALERDEEVWIEIERRQIIDENTPVG